MLNKTVRYHEQLLTFTARRTLFSSPSNNYRDPKNPKVFMQVSRDGQPLGKMVFEVRITTSCW